MKKIILALLIMVMILSNTAIIGGCSDDSEDIDPNRTQLYVGVFEGGYGTDWLYKFKELYEAKNPSAQIMIRPKKNEYTSNALLNTISIKTKGSPDLYFAPINYYDFASSGKLLDVTDTVNEKLTEYGEDRSIVEKMDDDMLKYYSSYSNDEGESQIMAIPWGSSVYSINYDVDLFEEKGLFFDKDGNFTTGLPDAQPKSDGQDSIAGTYDDGLPITYSDFNLLLEEMSYMNNIKPFVWSNIAGYRQGFLTSVFASYEGSYNFNLNKNMNGEYMFSGDSEPTQISVNNAYLLQKQTGKKVALEFAKNIINNNYYHESSFEPTNDFMAAQSAFLLSKTKAANGTDKRIAFLIDGGHWYNEAKSVIELYGAKNRRFGLMPFPKFPGSPATKATYYNSSSTQAVFIRSNPEQEELARDFLKFTSSEDMIRLMTRMSGIIRQFDYTMTPDDYKEMPYYYQTVAEAFTSDKVDVVSMLSGEPIIYENAQFFAFNNTWQWIGKAGAVALNEPFETFAKNPSLTAEEYFIGMQNTYNKNYWEAGFSKYFD